MLDPATWIIIAVISGLGMWKVLTWRHSQLDHFPHPKRSPIVGNLFQVELNRPEFRFIEWSKQLGDVFSLQLLGKSVLVLNSYECIHEALVKKGDQFAGRPQDYSFRVGFLTYNFQDIIYSNPCPIWHTLRKICHSNIKMFGTGMQRIEDINITITQAMLTQFQAMKGKSFDPKEIVFNSIMNAITMLLMERKYETTDEIFRRMVELEQLAAASMSASGKGLELDLLPWLRFFGNSTYKSMKELKENRDVIWDLLKEDLMSAETGKCTNIYENTNQGLIGTLFREFSVAKNTQNQLKEHHLKMASMDMLSAGITTTFNTFYAYLNIISQHPNIQSKLSQEVDTIVEPNQRVSLKHKKDMPFTQATLLELLRYTTVVPLSVPHCTLSSTSIGNKVVPPGVTVLANIWALHHDERFWDEPYKFKPERFLDDEGQLLDSSHDNRHHLMPFSAGPRVCLGEVLAMARLFLFIASVAQQFTITQGAKQVSCDSRKLKHGVILSSEDFEIIATERKSQ